MPATLRVLPQLIASERHLGYWLRLVAGHVSCRLQARLQEKGVTVSESLLLRELYRLGDATGILLAYRLGMTRGAVSKLIERLQSKYLIAATTYTAGKRDHAVSLTPVGRAIIPTLAALADEVDEEFFGHMPRSQREQIRLAFKHLVRIHKLKPVPME